MRARPLLYAAGGLLLGCFVGFFFANQVNRRELDELRAEVARARAAAPAATATTTASGNSNDNTPSAAPPQRSALTDEELRNVVAKADASPTDAEMQRKVGQGLYLYAAQFNKPELLPDAVRILKRANQAAPQNYDTLVMLGNALFDLARNNDPAQLTAARTIFTQALARKPDDVNVRAELGMAYYFASPSDPQRAIREYRKALAQDAQHEMALQGLAAALIATNQLAEARQRLEQLQQVSPDNPALSDLRAQLAQQQNAAQVTK